MSNLVVVRERLSAPARGRRQYRRTAGRCRSTMSVARHPSRVIVIIEHDARPRPPAAPSAVSVGVVTFGPPQARFGVEQVDRPCRLRGRSRCRRSSAACCAAMCRPRSGGPTISRTCRRSKASSRWRGSSSMTAAAGATSAPASRPSHRCTGRLDLADVNWRLDAAAAGVDSGVPRLRTSIVCGGATWKSRIAPTKRQLAWLAVGWLSARLGWSGETRPRLTESRVNDEAIRISVGTDLVASLNEHRVLITRGDSDSFTISVPQESEADAVAAELRNLGYDACLKR